MSLNESIARGWILALDDTCRTRASEGRKNSKMRSPHLVPQSRQVLEVLEEIKQISGDYELVFIGDHQSDRPMSENTVNKALSSMGYNTKTEVCVHGFRVMVCSALIESGLWSRDAVERQMSHQERNNVRAAYIHLVEHLDERRLCSSDGLTTLMLTAMVWPDR